MLRSVSVLACLALLFAAPVGCTTDDGGGGDAASSTGAAGTDIFGGGGGGGIRDVLSSGGTVHQGGDGASGAADGAAASSDGGSGATTDCVRDPGLDSCVAGLIRQLWEGCMKLELSTTCTTQTTSNPEAPTDTESRSCFGNGARRVVVSAQAGAEGDEHVAFTHTLTAPDGAECATLTGRLPNPAQPSTTTTVTLADGTTWTTVQAADPYLTVTCPDGVVELYDAPDFSDPSRICPLEFNPGFPCTEGACP